MLFESFTIFPQLGQSPVRSLPTLSTSAEQNTGYVKSIMSKQNLVSVPAWPVSREVFPCVSAAVEGADGAIVAEVAGAEAMVSVMVEAGVGAVAPAVFGATAGASIGALVGALVGAWAVAG